MGNYTLHKVYIDHDGNELITKELEDIDDDDELHIVPCYEFTKAAQVRLLDKLTSEPGLLGINITWDDSEDKWAVCLAYEKYHRNEYIGANELTRYGDTIWQALRYVALQYYRLKKVD